MGPRRMDGFGRSGAPQPAGRSRAAGVPAQSRPAVAQPMQRPVARPMQRPAASQQQTAYDRGGSAPVSRQAAAGRPAAAAPKKRSGLGWLAALVVGLLVIVGVASAIVALYVKYYK